MKHAKTHVPLLVFASVVTLFVACVYAYMYHEVSVSAAKTADAEQAVATGRLDSDRAQEFMKTYQASKASFERLPSLFVPSNNAVAFIESIESLGTATGATTSISSIQADSLDTSPAGTLGFVSARVSVSGSWTQVMRVLELAEILPYQSVVSDTRLSSGGDESGKHSTWNLSFAIKAAMLVPFTSSTTSSSNLPK